MLGLTPLGTIHTAISIVAVGAGVIAFARDGVISPSSHLGKTYIITTVLTCLTAFGIFQHGGFGKPHILGMLTLIVLAIAALARRSGLFGGASRYVETVSYSATLLFHLIPAATEIATRLPPSAPLAASADAPSLQAAAAVLFVLFVAVAVVQVRHLRSAPQRSRA